jgi:hypothetical protein
MMWQHCYPITTAILIAALGKPVYDHKYVMWICFGMELTVIQHRS